MGATERIKDKQIQLSLKSQAISQMMYQIYCRKCNIPRRAMFAHINKLVGLILKGLKLL